MRSKKCGHTMDEAAVNHLAKNAHRRTNQFACPVAGCTAVLNASDFEEDLETLAEIQKQHRQAMVHQNTLNQSMAKNIDDVDDVDED